VIFSATLWSTEPADGDVFSLAYSVDGANYLEMFTFSGPTPNEHLFVLPLETQGLLTVRLTDSDRTPGNRTTDSVFIDRLAIRSESGAGDPPLTPTDLTAAAVSAYQINVEWTDTADETGYQVQRSLDGQSWLAIDTLGENVTFYSDGDLSPATTYHYRIQAFNGAGASSPSATASVTTWDAPESGLAHVGDLDALGVPGKPKRWDATVTITVHDQEHNPLAGASITGSWDGAVSGVASCVTDSYGRCQVVWEGIKYSLGDATFAVTAIAHPDYSYDSSANHDADGDSDGTSISISRPSES
jgi:hypothetical protein